LLHSEKSDQRKRDVNGSGGKRGRDIGVKLSRKKGRGKKRTDPLLPRGTADVFYGLSLKKELKTGGVPQRGRKPNCGGRSGKGGKSDDPFREGKGRMTRAKQRLTNHDQRRHTGVIKEEEYLA